MHSSASRAMDGTSSVRCACEDSNLRFMSEARKEPNASAVSSGTVIIDRSPLAVHLGLVRRDVAKPDNPRFHCTYSLTREGPPLPVTYVTGCKKLTLKSARVYPK